MKIEINPDFYGVRCKRCSTMFTMGAMLRRWKDRQRETPIGLFYVKCPTCGIEELLRNPNVPTLEPPAPPPPIVRRFIERYLRRRRTIQ